MEWTVPTEKELSLYNRIITFAVSKDYKGNTIIDETLIERHWLSNGGTKESLVNLFFHLYPEWKDAKVNDTMIMSTKSAKAYTYKIAELDLKNNRIRFFKPKSTEVYREYWLITRYPYMKLLKKKKDEIPGSSGWLDLPY